jgi:hypothetical protein
MSEYSEQQPHLTLYPTIFLVSATALAYEILLIRLLAIIQFHHFAYMIISLALVGYGASGSFLSLVQENLVVRHRLVVSLCCLLLAVSIPLCFLGAQRVPFNAEAFFWDWKQFPRLFCLYLLLSIPFFFAALVISLNFAVFRFHIAALYTCDLSGAAVGGASGLLLLFVFLPETLLRILPLGALAAAIVCAFGTKSCKFIASITVCIAFLLCFLPSSLTTLRPSEYKGLPQLLRIKGTQVIDRKSGPLGDLTLVESREIPLRYAPGLSLSATGTIPEQLAVFTDGDSMSAITRFNGDLSVVDYVDLVTSALPFHLRKIEKLAILGSGTGNDVLQALYHHVPLIDAVELNPQIIELVRQNSSISGGIYDRENVRLHIAEGRGFIRESAEKYDLVQLSLVDSFNSSAAGLHGLQESYLYTVEAFADYLTHLAPDGYLSITRWVKVPPRDALKVVATALSAMQSLGMENADRRLLLIRGWQTCTVLVKNGFFTDDGIVRTKGFCDKRFFDAAYYPGMQRQQANKYNILSSPFFFDGVKMLLSEKSGDFMKAYKFNLGPARDDQPYFFHFFKWRALGELLALRSQGGLAQVEWGYPTLVVTLLQAIVASVLLILLPLLVFRRNSTGGSLKSWTIVRVLCYFSAIGLAFLFLEIGFIQKSLLYLHHPLYAVALVITVFLISAGAGSRFAGKVAGTGKDRSLLAKAMVLLLCLALFYIAVFPALSKLLLRHAMGLRIIVSILFFAPMAFCMGIPFPIAMTRLGKSDKQLIPWAWAVNGCASVISAVLAMLLAIHFGFNWLLVAALCLYGVAYFSLPGGGQESIRASDEEERFILQPLPMKQGVNGRMDDGAEGER